MVGLTGFALPFVPVGSVCSEPNILKDLAHCVFERLAGSQEGGALSWKTLLLGFPIVHPNPPATAAVAPIADSTTNGLQREWDDDAKNLSRAGTWTTLPRSNPVKRAYSLPDGSPVVTDAPESSCLDLGQVVFSRRRNRRIGRLLEDALP